MLHADVVIVGGGILGLSLALEMAENTGRVVLLEGRRLGSGATGSGFAWINATSKIDDEAYHRLNARAIAHYGQLEARFGAERLGLHTGGTLYWTSGDDTAGQKALRRRAAHLQEWDTPAALLDRAGIQALEPQVALSGDAVGLFAPDDRWLDPPRFLAFLVDQARTRDVELREHAVVTSFTRDAGGISAVETAQERIGARIVVLAAGVKTSALAALALGLADDAVPLVVRPVPGLLVETASGSAPNGAHRVLYPPDTGGLHLRPTPDGGLLLGADDTDALVSDDGDAPPVDPIHSLVERAQRYLPGLSRERLLAGITARVCVRPVPGDGFPIAGPVPGLAGLYVAVTHSGVTLGPLLAQLLAEEIVSGSMPPQLAPYRPARFPSLPAGPI